MTYKEYLEKKKRESSSSETTAAQTDSGNMTYKEYFIKKNAGKAAQDIYDRVNTWLNTNNRYITSYNDRYKDGNTAYRSDASDWYQNTYSNFSNSKTEADAIRTELDKYGKYLNKDWTDSIYSILDSETKKGDEIVADSKQDLDFWSQFESEDDYNKWQYDWLNTDGKTSAEKIHGRKDIYEGNKERISEIEQELPWYAKTWLPNFVEDIFLSKDDSAIRNEAESLEAENRRYDSMQGKMDKYYDITQKDDFGAVSANREYTNSTEEEMDAYDMAQSDVSVALSKGGYYDEEGNVRDARGNLVYVPEYKIEDKLGLFLSASTEDKSRAYNELSLTNGNYTNTWANLIREGDTSSWDQLEDDEIGIYYYLLSTEGQESAYKYLDDMKTELTRRSTEAMEKGIDEANGLEKFALNVAAVPARIVGGAVSAVDDASNLIQGKDINPYSRANSMLNFGQTVMSETEKDIVQATGGVEIPILKKNFGEVYSSVMQGVDSLVGVFTMGKMYLPFMMTGAASNEAADLYKKGASNAQIAAGGILAGTAEYFGEKIGIDHMLDMIGGKTSGKFLVELAKQMGIEYGEEWFTEGLNLMSDALVMQSQSELRSMFDYYKAEGLSDGQAFWNVTKDSIGRMHDAGVSGAIGAIVGGGIGGALGQVQKNAAYKREGQTILENDGYNALKALALDVAGAQKDGKLSRMSSGTDVSGMLKKAESNTNAKNVGKLSTAVETLRSKQNLSDITSDLKKAGLSSREAKLVAQYMSDTIDGRTLSEADQQRLEAIISENDAVLEVWNGLANQQVVDGKKLSASHPVNVRNEQHNLGRKGVVVDEDGIYATENTPESIKKVLEGNSIDVSKMTSVDDLSLSEDSVTRVSSTGAGVTVNKSKPIAKVVEVDGKKVVYYNTDQGQVSGNDISFGNEDDAILFESFTDLPPVIANAAIEAYDGSLPVPTYVMAMREGIVIYGKNNFKEVGKDILPNSMFSSLSKADQDLAIGLGRQLAEIETESLDQELKTAIREAAKHTSKNEKGKPAKKGTVTFEKNVKASTDIQKATVRFAEMLSKITGINIVFYDSKINPEHEFAGDDGVSSHDTIWLDMSNSHDNAIVYTLAHEFVHFAKKWSPKEYRVFTDFMVEQFAEHGKSLDELVRQKMGEIGTNDYDYAFEEVVADACERMLLDSKAMEKLALLKKKSPNVFKKFMQHIKELLEKLKLLHADTHTTNDYSAALNEMTDVLEKFYELFENMAVDAVQNFEAAEGNAEAAQGEVRYSEKDFPIDRAVKDIVRNSLATKNESKMRTLGVISQEENKGINRLSNRTNNDHYRGKYTNGKHLISDNAIRHMMAEHGDFLRESLRAQLPLKENDIARTLSAIKDNRVPKSLDHSRTRRGNPSIITSFEINGYTLYAEEITRSLSKNLPSDLIGHTMYKAPTLATAAVSTTSVATLPKRQSEVLCDYYMPKSINMSSDYFVSDKNGKPALLTFPKNQGVPVSDLLNGGLIALSSNANNLSGNLSQGYVRCKKPFYITANNRVFSNSDTNVSERIKALKDQGYDCFIFDYKTGDNHFVAVVNKSQIVDPQNMVGISKQKKKTSNRAILADTLESTIDTSNQEGKNELTMLQKYQADIGKIEELESRLAEINTELKEISFGKGKRDIRRQRELAEEKTKLVSRINIYDRRLLKYEATKPIKELLNKLKLLHADTHTTNDYSAALNEMEDVLGKFYELFENMAVDAVRNFEASSKFKNNDSINKHSKKMEQNIYDDPLYPRSKRESAAFNRSMANKTSDLKKGGKEVIFIYTADNVFVVDADGYMNGKIRSVIKIDGNEDRLRTLREEYRDVVDRERESIDEGIDSVRDGYRRYMRSISALRNGAKHSDDAGVDDGQRRSRARGDKEGSSPNSKEIKHQNKRVVEPITSKDVQILREIGKKSINQFTAEDIQKSQKWAHKFFQELGVKSPFFRAWYGDWRGHEAEPTVVVEQQSNSSSAGKAVNIDTKFVISWGNDFKGETINHAVGEKASIIAIGDIYEIVKNAVMFDTAVSMPTSKQKMKNTAFMHSFYTLYLNRSGEYNLLKMYVEEALSNNEEVVFRRAYQLKDIKKVANIPDGVLSEIGGLTEGNIATTISISNLFDLVKRYDKDFNPIPLNTPLIHPENGSPLTFFYDEKHQKEGTYHLTSNEGGEVVYAVVQNPYIVSNDDITYKEIESYVRSRGYDAVIFQLNGIADEVYVFSQNQVKSADNVGTFDRNDTDMKHQKKKTSNRAILADTLESTIDTSNQEGKNELTMLQKYQADIGKIEELESRLAEINTELKEISFGKGKRDIRRQRELAEEKTKLVNRIDIYDRRLLKYEATKPIKDLLAREKEQIRKQYRAEGSERVRVALNRKNDSIRLKKEKENLQKLVLETTAWLTKPKKGEIPCPDIIKEPLADFLAGIDTSSKKLLTKGVATQSDLKFAMAMDSLATAVEKIKNSQDPSNEDSDGAVIDGYLDLPPNFVENIRTQAEAIKNYIKLASEGDSIVNDMSADELKELSLIIKLLKKSIKEMQTLYTNYRFANAVALGKATMGYLDSLGEANKESKVKDFALWDNTVPYYAFRRFGEGGESIFESLMDAQDKLAFHADEILAFKEKNWTDKEVSSWSKDVQSITLENGEDLKFTVADAMSIYCLSKRYQAVGHLFGGGVRVVGVTKGDKKAADSKANLSPLDVAAICDTLTERQIEVANKMQEFMTTVCADWGNEIWMKRFLTKNFTEKAYFPIETDPNSRDKKDPAAKQSDLFRLLNISATKPLTDDANNKIVVRNIFDVFTAHTSDMARLNAYGMALLDYMKWLNYRERYVDSETGQVKLNGVRPSLEVAYGSAAEKYIVQLIKDVNGISDVAGDNAFSMKMIRSGKVAAVGANLRVAALQMTALPRACIVLDSKSIILGMGKRPSIKKAKKYCGIALWKSFGFYDTNIGKSMESQIKGDTKISEKMVELSMKGAELGDSIVWGYLWNACEYEIAKTKQYKVGSEEFNQAVAKKLREVVYASQVVDSVLTKSQLMRSRGGLNQMVSAFMSEPTLTYNVLLDCKSQFDNEAKRTGSKKAAWKATKRVIVRGVASYVVTNILTALAEGFADAFRDDDDDPFGEKFIEAFWENFLKDINPLNKIPIFNDIVSFIESRFGYGYFSSEDATTGYLDTIGKAYDAWVDIIKNGEDAERPLYYAIYNTAKAFSQFSGLPISNVMREVVTLWNNTAGAYDYNLKIRTYKVSQSADAENLYQAIEIGNEKQQQKMENKWSDEADRQKDLKKVIGEHYSAGEIDYDTAKDYLEDHCGMSDFDADKQLDKWKYTTENGTATGYSKFDDFYTAVESGKNLKAVIREYTDNGYEKEDLSSQITGHFKPIYKEMTKNERASLKGYLLNAYSVLGYDRCKKSKDIDKWLED